MGGSVLGGEPSPAGFVGPGDWDRLKYTAPEARPEEEFGRGLGLGLRRSPLACEGSVICRGAACVI